MHGQNLLVHLRKRRFYQVLELADEILGMAVHVDHIGRPRFESPIAAECLGELPAPAQEPLHERIDAITIEVYGSYQTHKKQETKSVLPYGACWQKSSNGVGFGEKLDRQPGPIPP